MGTPATYTAAASSEVDKFLYEVISELDSIGISTTVNEELLVNSLKQDFSQEELSNLNFEEICLNELVNKIALELSRWIGETVKNGKNLSNNFETGTRLSKGVMPPTKPSTKPLDVVVKSFRPRNGFLEIETNAVKRVADLAAGLTAENPVRSCLLYGIIVVKLENCFLMPAYPESLEGYIARWVLPSNNIDLQSFNGLFNAVNFLGDNKFVHADIKPANILLDGSGRLKLCDFGISKDYKSSRSGEPWFHRYRQFYEWEYRLPLDLSGVVKRCDARGGDHWALMIVVWQIACLGNQSGVIWPEALEIACPGRSPTVEETGLPPNFLVLLNGKGCFNFEPPSFIANKHWDYFPDSEQVILLLNAILSKILLFHPLTELVTPEKSAPVQEQEQASRLGPIAEVAVQAEEKAPAPVEIKDTQTLKRSALVMGLLVIGLMVAMAVTAGVGLLGAASVLAGAAALTALTSVPVVQLATESLALESTGTSTP